MKFLCAAVFLFSSVSGVALAQANGVPAGAQAWTSPLYAASESKGNASETKGNASETESKGNASETKGHSTERSALAEQIYCACTVPNTFA